MLETDLIIISKIKFKPYLIMIVICVNVYLTRVRRKKYEFLNNIEII